MRGKTIIATTALALVVAACAEPGKLAIRPLPSTLAQGRHPVSFRVAEAAGQFALGNVALALESYRKALREEPMSIDAMVGMAACYDSMGRFDLSRRHYEAALAVAPADTHLLDLLATSLTRQGLTTEADAVRREMAERSVQPTNPTAPAAPMAPAAVAIAASSVTVVLPVARPAIEAPVALNTARDLAPIAPIEARTATLLLGPRLERLSLGEVALVTRRADPPLRSRGPMLAAAPSTSPLLLLNAARSPGLAGRTRSLLAMHGFVGSLIGDAPRTRMTSLVIAPAAQRVRAEKIARALGLRSMVITGQRLTLLLGRDLAVRTPTRMPLLRG